MMASACSGVNYILSSDATEVDRELQNSSRLLARYREVRQASVIWERIEQARKLLNFANVENGAGEALTIELETAHQALKRAQQTAMRLEAVTITDLAVKVLVAAEDGFQSADINRQLKLEAQRLVEED